jgi:nicotinamidase-related amidase
MTDEPSNQLSGNPGELPQGYEPHELPADYEGKLWIEGQMRAYGAAAVEQEREKWASIVAPEHLVFGDEEWRIRSELADAIRKGE